YHLGEHLGVWQKRTLFEEGTRAPLIIRAPSFPGNGRACARIVEFVDIYPTLAGLASLKPPSNLDGRTLLPLLSDPAQEWDGIAITQILRPADVRLPAQVMGRTIRTERWRYTEWNEGGDGMELYDHQSDPHEFTNRAIRPNHESSLMMKQLHSLLETKARGVPPSSPVNPKRL
ncbi:MAG: iduronate-2-sulfatase, partial [Planctomycetaceae bacterium]|nr:iduronate-2-sulfatase [Planctomycetaceae bacterium]